MVSGRRRPRGSDENGKAIVGRLRRNIRDGHPRDLAEVLLRLGQVTAPLRLKKACRSSGLTPGQVLSWIMRLLEEDWGSLRALQRVRLVELANWWVMVSLCKTKWFELARCRVLEKRAELFGELVTNPFDEPEKRSRLGYRGNRPIVAIGTKVVDGELAIVNHGRRAGVSPFPGGVVPAGMGGEEKRMRRRAKAMASKVGEGWFEKVKGVDGGGE